MNCLKGTQVLCLNQTSQNGERETIMKYYYCNSKVRHEKWNIFRVSKRWCLTQHTMDTNFRNSFKGISILILLDRLPRLGVLALCWLIDSVWPFVMLAGWKSIHNTKQRISRDSSLFASSQFILLFVTFCRRQEKNCERMKKTETN